MKVPKFCGESILSIENTQNVTDLAVSAVSNLDLYQMCTKMRGIPACASLSPNVSMPQTLNAIVCGDCTVPMVTPPNGVSGCMHPGCENPQCAVSFAMIHRSDINKTSPYHKAKSNMAYPEDTRAIEHLNFLIRISFWVDLTEYRTSGGRRLVYVC